MTMDNIKESIRLIVQELFADNVRIEILKEAHKYIEDKDVHKLIDTYKDNIINGIENEIKNIFNSLPPERILSIVQESIDLNLNSILLEHEDNIQSKIDDSIDKQVSSSITTINEYINAKLQTLAHLQPTKIEVEDTVIEMEEITHELFEVILKYVARRQNVYLWGPSGAGKNFMVEQIAKVLNLDFRSVSTVKDEHILLGYTLGEYYRTTSFRYIWENGGVFFIDELDGSSEEVMTVLNGGLSSGYIQFPDSDNLIFKHKDCVIIAAGNTNGAGSTSQFNSRTKIDDASLDRFAVKEFKYSDKIENYIASTYNGNDNWSFELLIWFKYIRKELNELDIELVVSTRAFENILKYKDVEPIEALLETFLYKGKIDDYTKAKLEKEFPAMR